MNIHAKLIQISLSGSTKQPTEPHSWTALSYTWGSAQEVCYIWIDEKPFSVTATLHLALCSLRSTEDFRTIWIDQICINQSDNNERSCQILLMHRIYSSAEKVVAHLGTSPEPIEYLFHAISTLTEDAFERFCEIKYKSHGGDEAIRGRIYQTLNARLASDARYRNDKVFTFHALSWLMSCEWFRRVWTIQEAVLNNNMCLQIGLQSLEAIYLDRLLSLLEMSGHSSLSSVHAGSFHRPASLFALRRLYLSSGSRHIDIPVLLDSTKYRGVDDDRDRVYGLLGLLQDHISALSYQPSYDKTVEHVYMEMTHQLLMTDGNPKAFKFCCAQRLGSRYQVPSWSEDWSISGGCGAQSARRMYKRPRIYHAATDRPFRCLLELESKTLFVQGVKVGTVQAAIGPAKDANGYGMVWQGWTGLSDEPDHIRAICRTLVADNSTHPNKFARASAAFIDGLAKWAGDVTPENITEQLRELRRTLPFAASRIVDAFNLFIGSISLTGLRSPKQATSASRSSAIGLLHKMHKAVLTYLAPSCLGDPAASCRRV